MDEPQHVLGTKIVFVPRSRGQPSAVRARPGRALQQWAALDDDDDTTAGAPATSSMTVDNTNDDGGVDIDDAADDGEAEGDD